MYIYITVIYITVIYCEILAATFLLSQGQLKLHRQDTHWTQRHGITLTEESDIIYLQIHPESDFASTKQRKLDSTASIFLLDAPFVVKWLSLEKTAPFASGCGLQLGVGRGSKPWHTSRSMHLLSTLYRSTIPNKDNKAMVAH